MKDWITVKEAGEILEVTPRQVINRIHRGKLKAKKDGRVWLVHASLKEASPVTGETSEEVSEVTGEVPQEAYDQVKEQVEYLKEQIKKKDEQISQLHQLLMVSEGNYQQLLEDRRPFWKRWGKRKKTREEQ